MTTAKEVQKLHEAEKTAGAKRQNNAKVAFEGIAMITAAG
jgi:hypothetical protein